ncbi:MAG TPA: TIGR02281 family clan AA aspartic protease [Sedimenticola thiotaurini]|uniref:TIGR02281 family clan AA aspartic protease n=1 Tax=Sedimenticola thiotaurini TaxID=1543721 RepID=A0A831RJF8_9GAMM|nr:TIGR02281 family clan AA aspartic protease [Sedimenticola thiotaurini]
MPADGDGAAVGRIGRWMMVAAWLALLLLLTLFFSRYLEHRDNPNRDPAGSVTAGGVRQVVLLRNRAGHYVADGSINGSRVTFLLDTGATDVAVPLALAERLGLPRGLPTISRTANGNVRTWSTRLDEVRLGPIRLRDVRASILPGMKGNEVLLGMSFLKHLELVQRGRELILRQYRSGG